MALNYFLESLNKHFLIVIYKKLLILAVFYILATPIVDGPECVEIPAPILTLYTFSGFTTSFILFSISTAPSSLSQYPVNYSPT